ncbi:RNA polymerase sigma factor [Parapedobacter sp. DT-150]|uniref:RNA polymerase sigma factor n=1 Tax=Parapedobacter sp. DT-150 TaxID=3396162 RepID=UPI003F1BD617
MNATATGSLSDKDWVKKIMDGDRDAASLLIRHTDKLVAQIVYKMVGNHPERKDLIQDVYLKTFKNLPRFRFQCKLSTWVAQISYNTCLDHLQKSRPQPARLPLDQDEQESNQAAVETSQDSLDASQLLSHKQRVEILEATSASLPPIYHTLITLFHKQELSIEEISEITELPAGTIKNYLFRARKVLKERLLNQYKKEDL